MYDEKREVVFEIKAQIGVLHEAETGWTKEVNLVSWNGGSAKYDIREWDPDHERMSRGITLHADEMEKLLESVREKKPEIDNILNAPLKKEPDLER